MKEVMKLPAGWLWTNLNEISEIILGQSPPSSTYNETGNGLPFYQGKLEFGNIYPIPQKWCSAPKKIAEKGDVLISVRAPVGPTNICPEKSCIGRGLAAIRPLGGIETLFTLYLMRTFEKSIAEKGTGTTFDAITGIQLKEFDIPLPPLPEQRAIVSKIEQLFSDLDNGIENFKKAQAQLKIYRHAVLKYAFEGKLTEDWRAVHKNEMEPASVLLEHIKDETKKDAKRKFKELPPIDTRMLPEGWVYGKLEHLIYIAGRIGWRGLKAEEYTKEGPLFLSVYNLNKGNYVDFSEVYHISEERYDESPEIQLKNDDILLVKDGSGIGKLGIVKGLKTKATVNSSLLVIRSGKFFVPEYLFYFLKGPNMQRVVKERITGSATPHLFQRDIKKFELLIPPIKEQKKIVEEIERRLSVCDKMEATITESLQKAESLRQSILKKAFEGKLLNKKELEKARKASDWEPAEKLLERIKAEKMSIKTTNKDKK